MLAEHAANFGKFDTVNDGVLDDMQQRLDESIENERVDLDVRRLDLKDSLFALFRRGDANGTGKSRLERAKADEADLEKAFVDLGCDGTRLEGERLVGKEPLGKGDDLGQAVER